MQKSGIPKIRHYAGFLQIGHQCWGRYFLKVIYYLLLVTFPESTRYSYILPQ